MSTITSSNGGGAGSAGINGYWRSGTGPSANTHAHAHAHTGSLSSGNHSPLSSNSSSSSLSSNGGGVGGTTVHVKNYANGLLSPVTAASRYQSPYSMQPHSQSPYSQSQSHSQPSPLPRTINATSSTLSTGSSYNNNNSSNSSKYMHSTNSGSLNSSARLYSTGSSAYDEQRNGGGISKSQSQYNHSSNGLRKVNHASSNEINVTVNNNTSSASGSTGNGSGKYYSSQHHSNGLVSANGGGNYYGPGTERDKYSHQQSSATSSGGVSVLVGRSSSYSQINTIGTSRSSIGIGNGSGSSSSNGYNNYYLNNGQSSTSNSSFNSANGLSHHQQSQNQNTRYNSNQHQQSQSQSQHPQQKRMSNGYGLGANQMSTSLNGTVAVAVVSRSQSHSQLHSSQPSQSQSQSQSKQSETNSYNGITHSNQAHNGTSNRYGSSSGSSGLGVGGSSATTNSRQIAVNGSSTNSSAHRPAHRTNSYPSGGGGGSGTNGITIGDVSVFPVSGNKKVLVNGTTMNQSHTSASNSNNAGGRKKGILRKDGRKKKMSVTFPKEVCQVIGFGGDTTDEESDDEPILDPLDSASVTELLEKQSTTPLEKELNRLTTKNTNFNSIKTNLLGYTSIEIGPIVGCMNGNSLTGPSKPLISIGTFETRGQPLKIKKLGSDDWDREQQQQPKQKAVSFGGPKKQDEVKPAIVKVNGTIPTNANNSRVTATTGSAATTTTKLASSTQKQQPNANPTNAPAPNAMAAPIPASRQSLLNKDNKVNASNANAPSSNAGKGNAISSSQSQTKVNDNKSQSTSKSNVSMTGSSATGISSVNVTVNQESSSKLNSTTSEKSANKSLSSSSAQRMTEPAETSNIQVDDDTDTYNAEPPPIPVSAAPSSGSNNKTSSGSGSTSQSNSTTTTSASLSNLFILNDGNIASRRSTFLHDILSFDTPIRLEVDGGGEDNSSAQDSLDPPRVVKSDPKVDSPTLSDSPLMASTDDSMNHFDDSLEDSGLDIKTLKSKLQDTKRSLAETSSESDNEKSGSNSDSGTEHDFIERNRNKMNVLSNLESTPIKDKSKDGLFISVDDSTSVDRELSSSTAKLSPDSVLSETSVEESSLENHDDDDDVPPLEVVPPIHSNGLLASGPAIPPVLKRLAPPPPRPQEPAPRSESMYKNTNEEELYDDVTNLNEKSSEQEDKNEIFQEYTDEDIEESLYDDCVTLGQPPPPPTEKKGSSGSYDFTDTNNKSGLLDPDLHEKIPLKPDDGIEFIGIRKIDAESFLKENSPPPATTAAAKKNRVGMGSPKPKRRVNQFFSTIGKKAGAAFSRTPLDFSTPSSGPKSPTSPPVDVAAATFAHFSMFKRSLSQDEVNLTRTQEIYATLSPAMLKNKGLAPVLNKLSKLDFPNPKDKDEDKLSRKNKFSTSLKKFLKFGSKDSDTKYEFGSPGSQSGSDKTPTSPTNSDTRHEFGALQSNRKSSSSSGLAEIFDNGSISNSPRHSSVSHLEELSGNNSGKYYVGPQVSQQGTSGKNYGMSGACPARPPPPPPRVYSYDQINSGYKNEQHTHPYQQSQQQQYNNNGNGQSGNGGVTSSTHGPKPARPPPPVIRANKVAPSFVSVFANPSATGSSTSSLSRENYYNNGCQSQNSYDNLEQDQPPQLPPPLNQRRPASNFNAPHNAGNSGNDTVRGNPPNKPKRKASIYRPGESADQGAYTANYLETTYNHITSLNFETLKLIASQTPARIKRGPTQLQKFNKISPLRWSQFYVTDVEPLTHGKGFCFYSAFWEDESCLLLIQESLSCGSPPLEFDCIESMASFEDIIPSQFITWKPSEFVNTATGVKVFVSVLPTCTVQPLSNYVNSTNVSPSRKYFALLQSMDFWGRDDLADLIVFHQIPSETDSPISDYSCGSLASKSKHPSQQSSNFGLVYVVSARLKSGSLLSSQVSRGAFESAMSKLLFKNNSYHHLLCDNDQSILYRRIFAPGVGSHEVEAQLRLFLQLKLFGAQGNDLDKIIRYRSDKQVTQWMDKERAFCMKDAIERTLQRNSEPISPLRKSFVEFLMISDSCAKAVLDLIVDLHPDE